jgi:DNA-binding transcriptional ArsR family regulator
MKKRQRRTTGTEDVLKSPVRVRILGWLAGQSASRTKREIGRALSLSNAAVHYHVKKLTDAGLMAPAGTRPGPNSITERLFSAKAATKQRRDTMNDKEKSEFYLRYTMDSISEMHREAEQMIKSDWQANRFLVGCYGVYATEAEIKKLKTRLLKMLAQFHEEHNKPGRNTRPIAMTFGLVPSSGLAWGNTQKVFDMLS